jgi:acylphosphatase
MTATRFIITGRVQGVGYRWWATQEAERLSLRGWGRNRRDGSVELLAIGEAAAIEALAAACRRGPPGSAVAQVALSPAEDDGSAGFSQLSTI